ncbi:GNAT family protein [Nocardioides sp. CER19]|uniref:GNAT family N-acetyltransferase n=1 Tax=Nocardioides sp. CER19 TaxID=3038538 RepID=UPI002447D29E|nr:GNAT family protein [Nocardioides sp. CER19]MDH2415858.1 GNAT family protein [Nocardioides sp. CER19]
MTTDPLGAVEWPLRTDRLTLRRGTEPDLEAIWAYRRDPAVTRWLSAAPGTLAEHRASFIERGHLDQMIMVERDGTVVGDTMIRIEDAYAQHEIAERARGTQAELGWTLDPAYGGRGYATEAVRALVDLCFGPLGLRRVVALCFADNEPSWRLMERLGMRREQHLVRESLHRSGEWVDAYGYALLAEEWPR